MDIEVAGFDCWPSFSFKGAAGKDCGLHAGGNGALVIQTLFTQEMLARGYLANTSVAVSFALDDELVAQYLADVTAAFAQLAAWLAETNHSAEACKKFLKGPVRHGGPQRV